MKDALMVMVFAVLANHLGLMDAVVKVFVQIARCPKCSSFWFSMALLLLMGKDIITALACSIVVSYLSIWIGLILFELNKIYDKIWQRIKGK